jgi:hypothetical protein
MDSSSNQYIAASTNSIPLDDQVDHHFQKVLLLPNIIVNIYFILEPVLFSSLLMNFLFFDRVSKDSNYLYFVIFGSLVGPLGESSSYLNLLEMAAS